MVQAGPQSKILAELRRYWLICYADIVSSSNRGQSGGHLGGLAMPKVPITVYVEPGELAAIERQASDEGRTRSAWVYEALQSALHDRRTSPLEIVFDQLVKVRANQEVLLKTVSANNAKLEAARRDAHQLAERMAGEVRKRLA